MVCRENLNPEDLATQSVRLKEEQLRREEGRLKEIEVSPFRNVNSLILQLKVQKEISDRRQELLAKEEALKSLEARLATSQSSNTVHTPEGTPAPASP